MLNVDRYVNNWQVWKFIVQNYNYSAIDFYNLTSAPRLKSEPYTLSIQNHATRPLPHALLVMHRKPTYVSSSAILGL